MSNQKYDQNLAVELIRRKHGLDLTESDSDSALWGWEAIRAFLKVSSVRYLQHKIYNAHFGPLFLLDKTCGLTFFAKRPDLFAVLSTNVTDIIRQRDSEEEVEALVVITPTTLWEMRRYGDPQFERFVDLKAAFPHADKVRNGDLGLGPPTKIRVIPMCWNPESLSAYGRYHEKTIPLKRQASGSKPPKRLNKTPVSFQEGTLSYLCRNHGNPPWDHPENQDEN